MDDSAIHTQREYRYTFVLDDEVLSRLAIVGPAPKQGGVAAAYGRTSKGYQQTVPTQIEACRAKALGAGKKLRYVFRDEGGEGDDPTREGFNLMLHQALTGRFDTLIVWKTDRLGRNLADAAQVEQMLFDAGVALISCTEPVDTRTATGRFIFGILTSAAQLELENIRVRTRFQRDKLIREGRWIHGKPPFGYRKIRGGRLRREPREAALVVRANEALIASGSYARAALNMQEAGLSWRGSPWTAARVRSCIQNDIYSTGALPGEPGVLAPIIVPEALSQAARMVALRAVHRGRSSPSLRERAIKSIFAQYRTSLDLLPDSY